MSKPTYWELLKHPDWQRKRLEILQRDDFTCMECSATDRTLHVHHRYYTKGAKPWEYPDEALVTLCERCHEGYTHRTAEIVRLVGSLDWLSQEQVIGYLLGLAIRRGEPVDVGDGHQWVGVADAFHISPMAFHRHGGFAAEWDLNKLHKIKDRVRTLHDIGLAVVDADRGLVG